MFSKKGVLFFLLIIQSTLGFTQENDYCKYQTVLLYIRCNKKINEEIKTAFPKLTSKKEKYVELNIFPRVDFLGINPFKNELQGKEYFVKKELFGMDSSSYFKKFYFESYESDFLKKLVEPNDSKLYLTFSKSFENFLVVEIGDLRSKTTNYRFGSGMRIFFRFNSLGTIESVLYAGSNYG